MLLVSVFFFVIMCLQNIKSPENYKKKEKQTRKTEVPSGISILSLSFLTFIDHCQWSTVLGTEVGHGAWFLRLSCDAQLGIYFIEECRSPWFANTFSCSLMPNPDTRHHMLRCSGTASTSPLSWRWADRDFQPYFLIACAHTVSCFVARSKPAGKVLR